ncbi:MAG: FGGY family carbohydrate kinase [Chloroflexota bacterium]|nr:FGGY family carbohydrate kinase [Chloroflexota bacterium]
MSLYVGLDVGTTTLSAVILDAASGRLVVSCDHDNTASITASSRAELDLMALRALIVDLLAQTVREVGERREEIRALGVTGQMHGVALLSPDAEPLGPAITWQDGRVEEPVLGRDVSYLQRFMALAGGNEAFRRMGCLPAAGFMGPTLYWLQLNDQLPPPPARACFVPDAAVAFLIGRPPPTDPTDAASSGLYDVIDGCWDQALVEHLGLPVDILPPVEPSGQPAGELLASIAEATGLPFATPVMGALGDNQASFLGSVREPAEAILLNVGTGAQISALIDDFHRVSGVDTRPFPHGRYLLVGAGLFGGRSYALLRDFFRQVGQTFFRGRGDEALYQAMNALAAAVPPGAEGVRCAPFFTGTRQDPQLRASFTGLGPHTFTPGHLTRALLEGVGEAFYALYDRMRPLLGKREYLVGAGNGIRRNLLLARILAQRFGMPLYIAAHEEAAAMGAALLAAATMGDFDGVDAATEKLCYGTVIQSPSGRDAGEGAP